MEEKNNDLTQIIAQILNEIKQELGSDFDFEKINLAELERRSGISRAKLRRLKANGFVDAPHGLKGHKAEKTLLTGYTGIIDGLLRQGITNSEIALRNLKKNGYTGGLTIVKAYISAHKNLVPAKRQVVAPQGNRGRRYETNPGETFQMDWGFITVRRQDGTEYKLACFAMVCHHCGKIYIEFFPNAKQENLFIGMIHAFIYMGVPQKVLTDNMKSIVISRDSQGNPIWHKDYELFMNNIGFETKLCKPRHPFTKGKVERLVRYVKSNFIPGFVFTEITDLNYEALKWCNEHNGTYHRSVDCIPNECHERLCSVNAPLLEESPELSYYLCPERRISFDGFIHFEGRRFGVPYWYTEKTCRVKRDGYILYIYDSGMTRILTSHDVTWSRRDSFCKDQYAVEQPEEHPTAPVTAHISQLEAETPELGFRKFNFEEDWSDE